jgi:predicted RNA methylase
VSPNSSLSGVPLGSGTGNPELHLHLLSDHARTSAYREAIERIAPGRRVLDIGTGTGVLACFAARAGATRVYAIERTAIIDVAIAVATANGLNDRIEFIRGDATNVLLPERVDVVVSELLSNDLFGQRLLPVLGDARNRFLASGGLMIPRAATLLVAGLDSERFRQADSRGLGEVVANLSEHYEIDLTPLVEALETRDISADAYAHDVARSADHVLTEPMAVWTHDFACSAVRRGEVVEVPLTVVQDGVLNSVVAFWTAELDATTLISTAPGSPIGAWTQVVHRLPPRTVAAEDRVTVGVHLDPMADAPLRVLAQW